MMFIKLNDDEIEIGDRCPAKFLLVGHVMSSGSDASASASAIASVRVSGR